VTKSDLFQCGVARMQAWCALNSITPPRVEVTGEPELFGTCAYYRDAVIYISIPACAAIGRAGRAWSYPGHTVDRTPFGVIQHELGHHVDMAHGARPGLFGSSWRQETGEKEISSYCPNDNEWFAEMFRLFVTNPMLLQALRPRTFAKMAAWRSVETRPWERVLAGADRQIAVLRKRIKPETAPALELA
jgi:hypothetical protein